jgi:DNA-binding transcriptional LysR family regulator
MRNERESLRHIPAKMQTLNWNDLRYLLAIRRDATLSAAARRLRVDDTTVARRLAALQTRLRVRLIQRLADGTLRLTAAGERAVLHAERVEREVGALGAALSGADDAVAGSVRVTSVPIIVSRMLIPAVPALSRRHPGLHLELVADPRDLSLTRREADMALRLARPRTGGTRITARRIGTLRYAVYAAASCPPREAAVLPWITYDEAMGHLPQARWIEARGEAVAMLRLNDAEALIEAVIAGLGRSLLPCAIADRDTRLRRLGTKHRPAAVARELWLLTHAELRALPRIEAVAAWLEEFAPR